MCMFVCLLKKADEQHHDSVTMMMKALDEKEEQLKQGMFSRL